MIISLQAPIQLPFRKCKKVTRFQKNLHATRISLYSAMRISDIIRQVKFTLNGPEMITCNMNGSMAGNTVNTMIGIQIFVQSDLE